MGIYLTRKTNENVRNAATQADLLHTTKQCFQHFSRTKCKLRGVGATGVCVYAFETE